MQITTTTVDVIVEQHNHKVHALSCSVVSESSAFDGLNEAWNELLEYCDASVFQSFEWQRTWWKHFGESDRSARLHILLIRQRDRLVGIAPFYVQKIRTLGLLPFKKLAFIAQGPSDYLNVLFAQGFEAECADRVAEHLSTHGSTFDVLHLEEFTERSPNHLLLYEALVKRGMTGQHFINEYCPRTQLLETWEGTLASFKVDTRREIRRRRRNIHKNFTIEYDVVTREEDAARAIDEFEALHQSKWQADGHTGLFADSAVGVFHREVARLFAKRGWLFLAFMSANGVKVASLYCFTFRSDCDVYLTGNANRSDVFKFSPGRVLTGYCMEEAVKMGKTVFDFMRGTEPYKYELDAKDIPNWSLLMYNPRSTRPESRYRLDLLVQSLRRRATRERLLFSVIRNKHGLFSEEMRKHLSSRYEQTKIDAKKKAEAPERAVNVRPKDGRTEE